MKKYLLLLSCFTVSATLAQGQTQSGATGSTSKQTVQQQSGVNQPGTIQNGVNQPAGANQVSGVIPGGNTNRLPLAGNQIRFGTNTGAIPNAPGASNVQSTVPFGATNSLQFGGGRPDTFINEASGANAPGQIAPGANNQIQPGAVNNGTQLPTNNTPLAGSGAIQEPSGTANNPAGVAVPNSGAADAVFAQQLRTALARGGATRIFFPQTRSTVTLVNQNGSIILTGNVSSEEERRNIEARVKNSSGAASVENQLRVVNPQSGAISPPQLPNPGTGNRQLLNP